MALKKLYNLQLHFYTNRNSSMASALFKANEVDNKLDDADDQRLEGNKVADEVDHVAVEEVRLLESKRGEQRSGVDLLERTKSL